MRSKKEDCKVTINPLMILLFVSLWWYGIFFLVDNKAAIILNLALVVLVWSIDINKGQKEVKEIGKEKRN